MPAGRPPKLSKRQRRMIRSSDTPGNELAREYGVSEGLISQIKNAPWWKFARLANDNGQA